MNIKPAESCDYDIVSPGEIMLRLDRGVGKSINGTHSIENLCTCLAFPPPGHDHDASRRRGRSPYRIIVALPMKARLGPGISYI